MHDKVIQVTIHVFQKATGSPSNFDPLDNNGFPLPDYSALTNMVFTASDWMSHLNPLQLNNGSPNMSDTRVRFTVVQIMEWKSDYLWGLNSHNNAQELYDYVINKPGLNFKDNSIHWVIPGKEFFAIPGEGIGGRASAYGDKSWIFIHNVFQKHLANADPVGTIMHEIGHSCGLRHPFDNCCCSDTPVRTIVPANTWCNSNLPGCGNNVMDYTSKSDAMSRCQVLTMHYYLLGYYNGSNIKDVLRDPIAPVTPSISGNTCIFGTTPQAYILSNYEFGNEVFWSVSPANLFQVSSGCGNNFTLTPISATNSSATLTVSVNWGINGTRTATKNITLNATQPLIIGTYTYPGTSQNILLNTSPTPSPVPASSVSVILTNPLNSTFNWTKVSGPDNMVLSNFGRNGTMNMTLNSMTSYNVSTSTSCGNLSRGFTFYRPASALMSLSPNPAASSISITAASSQMVLIQGTSEHFAIDPHIDKVTIYNPLGKPIYKFNSANKLKQLQVDISSFISGTYRVEIWDDNLNYIQNLLIVK